MSLTAMLAYSQLKINRRRTIWTLVGIILSTALITTVCTLVASGTNAVVMLGGDPAQHGVLFVIFAIPAAIVITIIVAMSVIVISNCFSISAAQRTAQFGILKSTGATARQIQATVMYESIFLSLMGIPAGLIVGLVLAYGGVSVANTQLLILDELVHMMINTISVRLVYTVSWVSLLAAAVMSFSAVLLSARKPAKKAAKIPAIEAIRGAGEVKISAKQIQTNRLVQKIFGYEGVLAAKSIKRSKRNFRANVISLTMAVIMFVVASGISGVAGQIEDLMIGMIDAPIIVDYTSDRVWLHDPYTDEWQSSFPTPIHSGAANQITARLREFPGVKIWGMGGAWEEYTAVLPREAMTEKMRGLSGEETAAASGIIVVDQETHDYLASLANVPHGSNILLNQLSINDRGNVVIFQPFYAEKITAITLQNSVTGETHWRQIQGHLTADQLPTEMRANNPAASRAVTVIVPYGYVRGFSWLATPADPGDTAAFMDFANTVLDDFFPDRLGESNFRATVFKSTDFIRILNLGITVAAVFIYSFTALLTLIGLTGVISTISTNVRMRRHEFAVLQSIGMTYSGLKHMLNLESVMASLRALAWGLPIALALTYIIQIPIRDMFPVPYRLPWQAAAQATLATLAITWLTMRIAIAQIRKENIAESIKKIAPT